MLKLQLLSPHLLGAVDLMQCQVSTHPQTTNSLWFFFYVYLCVSMWQYACQYTSSRRTEPVFPCDSQTWELREISKHQALAFLLIISLAFLPILCIYMHVYIHVESEDFLQELVLFHIQDRNQINCWVASAFTCWHAVMQPRYLWSIFKCFLYLYFYFMCVCFSCSLSVQCACAAWGGHKRILDSLELEL